MIFCRILAILLWIGVLGFGVYANEYLSWQKNTWIIYGLSALVVSCIVSILAFFEIKDFKNISGEVLVFRERMAQRLMVLLLVLVWLALMAGGVLLKVVYGIGGGALGGYIFCAVIVGIICSAIVIFSEEDVSSRLIQNKKEHNPDA